MEQELGDRLNIHVVEADLTDYDALKVWFKQLPAITLKNRISITKNRQESADRVSTITGGKLDYLVANAGKVADWSSYLPPSVT